MLNTITQIKLNSLKGLLVPTTMSSTRSRTTPTARHGEHKRVTYAQLTERRKGLPYDFPLTSNSLESVASDPCRGDAADLQTQVEDFADQTYPVMHAAAEDLIRDYLTLFPSDYPGWTPRDFVHHCLTKRPLVFWEDYDDYKKPDGQQGSGWTHTQRGGEYLCYEEIEFAAIVGLSIPTFFINAGDRFNCGRVETDLDSFTTQGYFHAGVGSRMEKEGFMEWKHSVVTRTQNTEARGYGRDSSDLVLSLWAQFFGLDHFPTWDDVNDFVQANPSQTRYVRMRCGGYFDTRIYARRLEMVLLPYLLQAESVGARALKKAFAHLSGIGLGVWIPDGVDQSVPSKVFVDTVFRLVRNHQFKWLHTLNFSWFDSYNDEKPESIVTGASVSCAVAFNKRDPAALVPADTILYALFAWDGNAYIGNEYWLGQLSASGDPAAASCSCIAELGNPDVNTENVCGKKTKFLSPVALEPTPEEEVRVCNGYIAVPPAIVDSVLREGYKCRSRPNVPLSLTKTDLAERFPGDVVLEVFGLDASRLCPMTREGAGQAVRGKTLAPEHLRRSE